jgi:hypothetical protein
MKLFIKVLGWILMLFTMSMAFSQLDIYINRCWWTFIIKIIWGILLWFMYDAFKDYVSEY